MTSGPATRAMPERINSRGVATRQLILIEAERLFAERGIEAVPLRDIGVAAGQKNNAAVQYHFGSREQIIREIITTRGDETERVRTSMVADLTLGARVPDIHDIMSAFVTPLAIHLEDGNHYLAFFSRYIIEEGGYEALGMSQLNTGSSVIALQVLASRLLPHLPEAVFRERWWTALSSSVHTLARYQAAQRKRGRMPADRDALLGDLITFMAAGLAAPHTR